jgi:hypothetical protein
VTLLQQRLGVEFACAETAHRLLHLMCCCRTNLSFAAVQLNTDLGFDEKTYGLGAGMFFATCEPAGTMHSIPSGTVLGQHARLGLAGAAPQLQPTTGWLGAAATKVVCPACVIEPAANFAVCCRCLDASASQPHDD